MAVDREPVGVSSGGVGTATYVGKSLEDRRGAIPQVAARLAGVAAEGGGTLREPAASR
jgi:hypothetical protein